MKNMNTVIILVLTSLVISNAQAGINELKGLAGVYQGNEACPQDSATVVTTEDSLEIYYPNSSTLFSDINKRAKISFYDQTRTRLTNKDGVIRIANEHRSCTHFVFDCTNWRPDQDVEFSDNSFTVP